MRALVIGASGGFGGAVAKEMVSRGIEVTAMVRQGGKDPQIEGLWQVTGDALDRDAVMRAAQGMDVIVHGFNVPYHRWQKEALRALDNAIEAAVRMQATILFPGNVYGLGPDFSAPLAEDCSREAPTELGRLRNEMERALTEASQRGARVIVLRAGDYFGPRAGNTWFGEIVKKALDGGPILDPARSDVPHAWAYLPDVARAAVDLLQRRTMLAPYEEVHFAGHVLSSEALVQALRSALGDSARKVRGMPWWALHAVAPFWPMGRYLLQMRYLWQEPVILDGEKLVKRLGEWQDTPFEEALGHALAGMGFHAAHHAASAEAA